MLILKYCILFILFHRITGKDGVCYEDKIVSGGTVVAEKCCHDYRKGSDGMCEECPAGSYGENCLHKCTTPFYGRLCSSKCTCESRCHYIYGCTAQSTTAMESTVGATTESSILSMPTVISTEQDTTNNNQVYREAGNQKKGQLTLWVYVAVVGVLLVVIGAALLFKVILAKPICNYMSNSKQTEHEGNLRIVRIQPILEEINDASSEEDVYCEIRESRMIDCVNQARPLTGRFNSNVKHFTKKCSTIRENIYNHLNYNQSLPNLCIGNEYEHAHANNAIGLLTNSENCLTEVRENRKLQSVPELGSSDSYEEVSCSTNYGIIWGNNDHHE